MAGWLNDRADASALNPADSPRSSAMRALILLNPLEASFTTKEEGVGLELAAAPSWDQRPMETKHREGNP